MHAPTYLLALHDFRPCINSPFYYANARSIVNAGSLVCCKSFLQLNLNCLVMWCSKILCYSLIQMPGWASHIFGSISFNYYCPPRVIGIGIIDVSTGLHKLNEGLNFLCIILPFCPSISINVPNQGTNAFYKYQVFFIWTSQNSSGFKKKLTSLKFWGTYQG